MEKTKVLFVDDDVALGQVVLLALRSLGYAAEYCTTLLGVQSMVKEMSPDIIVLDVEIGDRNGIDAVAELKSVAPYTPILFVSSHTGSLDVAKALDAGGTAYLKKPFEVEELIAYVRRYAPDFHAKGISFGKFHLRLGDDMLMRGDDVVKHLTPFESKILKLLVQNINRTVSREQIEWELWQGVSSNEYSLNNYVTKLRKYLAEDEAVSLETVPKVGYMLSVS